MAVAGQHREIIECMSSNLQGLPSGVSVHHGRQLFPSVWQDLLSTRRQVALPAWQPLVDSTHYPTAGRDHKHFGYQELLDPLRSRPPLLEALLGQQLLEGEASPRHAHDGQALDWAVNLGESLQGEWHGPTASLRVAQPSERTSGHSLRPRNLVVM